nr:MAG TPA: hypothetical protein [Caudoviricetes sp.]
MAKFYGNIGYCTMTETAPGVQVEEITVRQYYGDFVRNTRRLQGTEHLNDDISFNGQLSIVSDPYARENYFAMRYAEFGGAKWKITEVEVQYPRLILTLGGIYNGNET